MKKDESFPFIFNPKKLVAELNQMLEKKIWLKILIALFLGIITGILIKGYEEKISSVVLSSIINWIGLPGKLFLSLIQMIVIPLVFVSVIKGITSNKDISLLKKLGIRTAGYFLFTTVISISIGFGVSAIIKPGHDIHLKKGISKSIDEEKIRQSLSIENVPSQIVNLLPANPMVAMSEGKMLQVVLFAMIIGFALLAIDSKQSSSLMDLFSSVQEVCMIIVKWAMKLAPLAVFGLLVEATAKTGVDSLWGMFSYIVTVLLGLFGIMIFYLFLVRVIGKIKIFDFLKKIRQVQLLAFSTSSSAAVMPLTLETAENDLKLNQSVSRFVIPLGTTVNMDGTALYQAVATVFLAHTAGIELSFSAILLVVVTAIGASIGSPGTPGIGVVILSGLLINIGVPTSGIALILGVDRILDMCRTVVNVTGDLTASVVLSKLNMIKIGEKNENYS